MICNKCMSRTERGETLGFQHSHKRTIFSLGAWIKVAVGRSHEHMHRIRRMGLFVMNITSGCRGNGRKHRLYVCNSVDPDGREGEFFFRLYLCH